MTASRFEVSVATHGWAIGVVFGLLFAFPAMGNAEQQRLVLAGVTLIDGTDGARLAESRIVIVDGRFACMSRPDGCAAAPGDHRYDISETWITPEG